MKKKHPDGTLKDLTAQSKNPVFLRNMAILHEVCRETSASGKNDYTPAAIGRTSQARGGPSLNTLYSPKGAHFRKLIDAWAEWEGVEPKKPAARLPEVTSDNEILSKIDDLVVRSYMGIVLADRRRLRAEVITLKALSKGTPVIDIRPQISNNAVQVFEPIAALTEDELETLRNATDSTWLKRHQLGEGVRGELLDLDGKMILPRGALPAIRKMLGGSPVRPSPSPSK